MAQGLAFTKANSTLSVIDTNGSQWAFTGACTLNMNPGNLTSSPKTADYWLQGNGLTLRFAQVDIATIAGLAPSGTPATDFASLKALLPLYV